MLVASIVDISNRTTMDMDGSVLMYPVNSTTIESMIKEICNTCADSEVGFQLLRIEEIRDEDKYAGYRVHLLGKFDRLKTDIKVDITTGDAITPGPILRPYTTIITGKKIEIYAYPTETILAEKTETILSRGLANTRLRDFYDIYVLYKCHQFNPEHLKKALRNTFQRRGTSKLLLEYETILTTLEKDEQMNAEWDRFSKRYSFTEGLSFKQCIDTAWIIISSLTNS
ncbi:MAG: nucleotidyl transferase AbiEii/AbiGii toxin family protein [Bacilli bacterium]|nr:nucleotidyl transferase AbiEii/AbiGii toxin family protein [Bacilli bacterium]